MPPDYKKSQKTNEKPTCRVSRCFIKAIDGSIYCKSHDKAIYNKSKPRKSISHTNGKKKKKQRNQRIIERDKAKVSFQKYCRYRDSRPDGTATCISCGAIVVWNVNADGGHLIPAETEGTCFDERNCNLQCKKCNMSRMQTSEAIDTYKRNVDIKWGEGTYDDLYVQSKTSPKRGAFEYITIREFYDKKFSNLKNERESLKP